jgi:peptide/nickel transport system substrate-binding protein
MKILIYLLLCVIVVFGMVLASCGKQTSTSTTTPLTTTSTQSTSTSTTTQKTVTSTTTTSTSTSIQQYGGILKIGSRGGTSNIGDPARNWSSLDPVYAIPCVEDLVTLAPDGSGKPYPMLATSWQYSSDYTSITFNLRKNVKFHDGTDFNAEAAKFCLDLMRNGPRQELKTVKSIDVVDESTIKLNLSSYQSGFLFGMAGFVSAIVSPTNYKKVGADAAAFAPVGTGPFQYVSYTPNVSVKYKRFDGYWGGKPYLDGVEIYWIADPMTALAALKSGELDATRQINTNDYADLAKTADYSHAALPTLCYGFMGDSAHPDSPYADIRVRQAISYAMNTEAIAKAVGYSYYEPGKELVPTGSWAYDKTTVGYPYDPKQAKILLALSGYSTGLNTSLQHDSGTPARNDAFNMAQAMLKEVGINMELKGVTGPNVTKIRATGWSKSLVDYQFNCAPDNEPGQQLWGYFSSQASIINPNSVGIPPEYDAKLLAELGDRDENTYRTTIQGLMKDIIDKYCLVNPVYINSSIMISHSYVHDFNWAVYSNTQWDPAKVWISKH